MLLRDGRVGAQDLVDVELLCSAAARGASERAWALGRARGANGGSRAKQRRAAASTVTVPRRARHAGTDGARVARRGRELGEGHALASMLVVRGMAICSEQSWCDERRGGGSGPALRTVSSLVFYFRPRKMTLCRERDRSMTSR